MSMMLRMAGTLGQRRMSPLHPMTRDYIARLQAVDGHEPAFDAANDYLIRELVNLGGAYWDTMGTMTTLVGKKWEGLLVPLRDGMNFGTNGGNNFVSGDFDAKTGLVGDGSSKYIDSNRNNNADGQNDQAMGLYATVLDSSASGFPALMGAGNTEIGCNLIARNSDPTTTMLTRNRRVSGATDSTVNGNAVGYMGMSRSGSSQYTYRANATSIDYTRSSATPLSRNIYIYAFSTSLLAAGSPTDARLSLYHIGPALNLATLDGILTEYMARIDEVTL